MIRHVLGLLIIGWLMLPLEAGASGVEARREYIARNYEAALRAAQSGAELGDSVAMLILGLLHFEGRAVSRDYKAALRWWRASADLGNNKAQNNIGLIFHEGLGVEKNYKEAAKRFELSASRGEALAYKSLGEMHEYGHGFAIDYRSALEMYNKAEALYKKELLEDPDNSEKIRTRIAFVSQKIRVLSQYLDKLAPMPVLSTPQRAHSQTTTPK